MSSFNLQIFQLIYTAQPSEGTLFFAKLLAEQLIWLAPLSLVCAWLWGDDAIRKTSLRGALTGGLALALAQVFAQAFYVPRPFAAGFGPPLIPHAVDSSFPSDHLTLLGAIAISFLLERRSRWLGVGLTLVSFLVAWARIYLRVHFPFDVLGGFAVGSFSAWAVFAWGRPVVDLAFRLALSVHETALGPFIRRGWVRA